jgi:CheY-like chemotaxis protein
VDYISDMSEKMKTTVLIVGDNQDAAETLAILIRDAGHEALVAYDTESGLTVANNSLPDFIFHDVGMPAFDGYEAARRLRRSEKFARTILVAVTPDDATEDRKRAKLAGFDLHMSKPVYFEDLIEILKRSSRPH